MTDRKEIIHKIGSINTKTSEERIQIMKESMEVLRQNAIDPRAFESIDDEGEEKINMSDKKDLIDFLMKKIQEEQIWICEGSNSALQDELAEARIAKYREIVDLLYDIDRDITHCAKCGLDLGPVYCPKCYKENGHYHDSFNPYKD